MASLCVRRTSRASSSGIAVRVLGDGDVVDGSKILRFWRKLEIKIRVAALTTIGIFRRRVRIVRLGSRYGGWLVPVRLMYEGMLVVSAGVGEDTTFDAELVARYNCRIIGIDPTPRAVRHVQRSVASLGDAFNLVEVALSGSDDARPFYPPASPEHVSYSLVDQNGSAAPLMVKTARLSSVMRSLFDGDVPQIGLMKLDIEGAEGEVICDILDSGFRPPVICVEFDRRGLHHMLDTMWRIRRGGYVLVAVEGLNATFIAKNAVGPARGVPDGG